MADYSKQTVAQLRAVLKERGIPSTGLTRKQQIIEKLQEHDAANAEPSPAEDDASAEETTPVAEPAAAAAAPDAQDATPTADNANAEATSEEERQQQDDATVEKVSGEAAPESAPDTAPAHHEPIQPVEDMPLGDAIADRDFQDDALAPPEVDRAPEVPDDDATQRPTTANTSVSQTPIPSHEQPSPTPAAEPPVATAESSRLGSPELKEDSRKRKRRSVTPPVNTEDAAKKRLKQDEDNAPIVHLQEDADVEVQKTRDVVMEEADAPVDGEPAETVLPAKTSDDVVDVTGSKVAEELKDSEGIHGEDPGVGERGQQVHEEREEKRIRSKSPEDEKGTDLERTRKALWADFIPEEKVSEWIEREEKEGGGRMGKRWEVVYEPDEGDAGVQAELREPPTGPAAEKSFLALDKLFRSTTAKPKLYFQPIEKTLADKRLDELDRCTSRDWKPSDAAGGTERRYTFEDGDVLVDAEVHTALVEEEVALEEGSAIEDGAFSTD
ncbi:DNA-binding SAP [Neofusicoccum parvum]|uniref:DNA-binding SAP n=1 Tax=Neofusicoccum parvum TaxID=310453 RepID=A0ACB5RW55_9PEZI|nr:DNA-binding SAP [Neofusicoccum parvum]